jgi:hypothetical protein
MAKLTTEPFALAELQRARPARLMHAPSPLYAIGVDLALRLHAVLTSILDDTWCPNHLRFVPHAAADPNAGTVNACGARRVAVFARAYNLLLSLAALGNLPYADPNEGSCLARWEARWREVARALARQQAQRARRVLRQPPVPHAEFEALRAKLSATARRSEYGGRVVDWSVLTPKERARAELYERWVARAQRAGAFSEAWNAIDARDREVISWNAKNIAYVTSLGPSAPLHRYPSTTVPMYSLWLVDALLNWAGVELAQPAVVAEHALELRAQRAVEREVKAARSAVAAARDAGTTLPNRWRAVSSLLRVAGEAVAESVPDTFEDAYGYDSQLTCAPPPRMAARARSQLATQIRAFYGALADAANDFALVAEARPVGASLPTGVAAAFADTLLTIADPPLRPAVIRYESEVSSYARAAVAKLVAGSRLRAVQKQYKAAAEDEASTEAEEFLAALRVEVARAQALAAPKTRRNGGVLAALDARVRALRE